MKTKLLLLASAALLLVGCAKEIAPEGNSEGGEVSVTFQAAMPESAATKAIADNDGNAAKINHWVMEVRDAQNDLFLRQEKDGVEGVLQQSFSFNLFKNQTYTIQFWADTKGAYNTADLTAVSTVGAVANLDTRDAFSANVEYKSEKNETKAITLHRPFAQLNIITTDLAKMKAQVEAASYSKYAPKELQLTTMVPTTFNVQKQLAGNAEPVVLSAANCYADYEAGTANTTILMDYIFASAAEKDLVDLEFSFKSNGNPIEYTLTSIPFQRNYRTNIMGDFLSNTSNWNVVVDPVWNGEINTNYITEGSIAAANKALKEGKTAINVDTPSDYSSPIVLPAESNGKSVSINVVGTQGQTIKFELESGAQGPENLYVTSDADALNINTPNSHVVVNGGDFSTVTAATSATTLVVGKNVTIDELNVTAGNIEIHGIVGSINKASSCEVKYIIETAEALRAVAAKISATTQSVTFPEIIFAADIDLNNEEWAPVNAYHAQLNIDGKGHVVKNLKVTDYTGTYIGFISQVSGASIKNLTFQNATLTNAATNSGARGGVIVGWSYACNIDNCHIIDATVTGTQKVAGILGAMSVEGGAGLNSVTNCSVKNLTMSANDPADKLYQAGAIVGYVQLVNANPAGVLIEGNKIENITLNDACGDEGNNPYYCGPFIGDIVRKQKVEGQSIILNNNTIAGTNTEVFKTIYSSPYFGWTTNTENFDGAIAPLLIDGEKWVPDYAFECGGVKYATLAQAVAAAAGTADKTVNIIKAGTYSLTNLPQNVTIAGMEGVKMDCTGTGSIASVPNGATFKDIEFSFGNSNYHGFQHAGKIVFNDCTLNGYLVGYGPIEYNGCTVKQETNDVYSVQVYGNDFTCNNCEFFGTNKAILVYSESLDRVSNITVNKCKFHASSTEDLKAAVQMNAVANSCTGKYNTVIDGCTIDGFTKVYGFKHNPKRIAATVKVDGKVVYDGTYNLSLASAADLVEFAAAVNSGNTTFEGKTVYLENDVDMTGIAWTAIGTVSGYPSYTFAGTFDGQNHTVSNLTCDATEAENSTAGFFGSVTGNVKNLKMKDVAITSKHFAGAICGYCSTNCSVFENCHVIGGTITSTPEYLGTGWDNGDKVGGIVGLSQSGEVIKNCSVDGITVKAFRDLGGICGASSANISGCVVKNSTIIQDNTNGYKTGIDTYHEILGRDLGAVLSDNAFGNVTVKSIN